MTSKLTRMTLAPRHAARRADVAGVRPDRQSRQSRRRCAKPRRRPTRRASRPAKARSWSTSPASGRRTAPTASTISSRTASTTACASSACSTASWRSSASTAIRRSRPRGATRGSRTIRSSRATGAASSPTRWPGRTRAPARSSSTTATTARSTVRTSRRSARCRRGMDVVDTLHNGYGEGAPRGQGPGPGTRPDGRQRLSGQELPAARLRQEGNDHQVIVIRSENDYSKRNKTMAKPEDTMVLETTQGKVVIAMRPDLAPGHVARIKELVREGFYDGIVFHRVIDGFMAQTGCPHGTGTGGSGKKLKAEFNKRAAQRGTVSMARAQNPEFRRQPVLHLLRRRIVPQRPVHGLGRSHRRHGERRQDQARRAGAESRQDRVGEDGATSEPRDLALRTYRPLRQALCRSAIAGLPRRPSLAREPLVLGIADRAKDARKEHRRRAEARAIRHHSGWDVASGIRTFDHHRAHGTLPIHAVLHGPLTTGCIRRWFDVERGDTATNAATFAPRFTMDFTRQINSAVVRNQFQSRAFLADEHHQ